MDGKANFATTEADDVDLKTVADYTYLLPLARWRMGAANRGALDAYLAQGARDGKIVRIGDPSRSPPELAPLHNAVVDFTC
ncbi:MAG TPA: hypothetical protein VIJ94_05665 [Caulobacteraceae bacterium]